MAQVSASSKSMVQGMEKRINLAVTHVIRDIARIYPGVTIFREETLVCSNGRKQRPDGGAIWLQSLHSKSLILVIEAKFNNAFGNAYERIGTCLSESESVCKKHGAHRVVFFSGDGFAKNHSNIKTVKNFEKNHHKTMCFYQNDLFSVQQVYDILMPLLVEHIKQNKTI
jgi:hypothetical protein